MLTFAAEKETLDKEEPSVTVPCTYFKMGYQPVWLFGSQVLIFGIQTELTSDLLTMEKG